MRPSYTNQSTSTEVVPGFKNLPEQYMHYTFVHLCGNLFRNCHLIFSVNGYAPILFGRGDFPEIWLQGPLGPNNEWQVIIQKNIAVHTHANFLRKDLPVFANPQKAITLSFRQSLVAEISSFDSASIHIDRLDLRPIGIEIFGDRTELKVGNNKLMQNMIAGARIAIQLE